METYKQHIIEFWAQAVDIWFKGGWAMIGIAIIAMMIFLLGMNIYTRFLGKGFTRVPEKKWRRWIDHPAERRGPIGEMLDFISGVKTVEEAAVVFAELRAAEIRPFARDLRVMRICVSVAPLLGLLGTVTGMLATFAALASESGEKVLDLVSAGISEALITTETGLVIALPGVFFQYILARMYERYRAFLAHLETVYTQRLYTAQVRGKAA